MRKILLQYTERNVKNISLSTEKNVNSKDLKVKENDELLTLFNNKHYTTQSLINYEAKSLKPNLFINFFIPVYI